MCYKTRRGIEISDIRGIYPKDNAEWLNWIAQKKSLYLDKAKIQDLIDKQRMNFAEVEYLNLDLISKLVENFDNPIINDDFGEIAPKAASAEPVTYDDNGNVIPLSERFNPEKDDIRFSFVGATGLMKAAKTDEEKQAIKDNLNAAKVALRKPDLTLEDKRKIKLATGWELRPDGKVRHEIQDFKLRGAGAATFVRPWNGDGSFEQKTLGEVLREDEEIFTLYPELRDIKVSVERLPEKAYAQFSARDNKITLSPGIMKDVKGRSNAMRIGNTAYSALLHEVQHAIQRQEGWARGGNTFNVGEGAENLNPDEYKKQAGEIEARNVQARAKMSDEERANTLAEETEDVAREEAIIRFSKRTKPAPKETIVVYKLMRLHNGELYPELP